MNPQLKTELRQKLADLISHVFNRDCGGDPVHYGRRVVPGRGQQPLFSGVPVGPNQNLPDRSPRRLPGQYRNPNPTGRADEGNMLGSWTPKDEDMHPRGPDGRWIDKDDAEITLFDEAGNAKPEVTAGHDQSTPRTPTKSIHPIYHDRNSLFAYALHKKLHEAGIAPEAPKPPTPTNHAELKAKIGLSEQDVLLFRHSNNFRAHGTDAAVMDQHIGHSVIPHDQFPEQAKRLQANGVKIAIAAPPQPTPAPQSPAPEPTPPTPQATQPPPAGKPSQKEIQDLVVKSTNLLYKIGKELGVGKQNRDELDDFVQNAQLAALKNWEKFDPAKGSFNTWVGKVAQRTGINEFNKQHKTKKRAAAGTVSLDEHLPSSKGNPETGVSTLADMRSTGITPENQEMSRRLQAAVESLPPKKRQLVNAIVVEGKSAAEVARELGVTRQAVTKEWAKLKGKIAAIDSQASKKLFYSRLREVLLGLRFHAVAPLYG